MANDSNSRNAPDAKRVDINEASEVRYWCDKWGVTEGQLRTAVKSVGARVIDVRRYLGEK